LVGLESGAFAHIVFQNLVLTHILQMEMRLLWSRGIGSG
jgi:hypothetical protein